MSSGFELQDSRFGHLELVDGVARVHFPHALVHRARGRPGRSAGGLWSQQAGLTLSEARLLAPAPAAGTVVEGYLEVGGVRHDILPLPFTRRTAARLYLRLLEGGELQVEGQCPLVELFGRPRFLTRVHHQSDVPSLVLWIHSEFPHLEKTASNSCGTRIHCEPKCLPDHHANR